MSDPQPPDGRRPWWLHLICAVVGLPVLFAYWYAQYAIQEWLKSWWK